MSTQSPPSSKSPRIAPTSRSVGRALLWPAAAVVLGALLIHNSFDTSTEGKRLGHPASTTPADLALPRSTPKRLSIREIGVDAPFTPLSIGASGQLNAPPADNNNLVGWFQGGPAPGERGASIVAGHVDTKTGPAVFSHLDTLKPGSTIDIFREDGTVATFKVDSVETFSKAHFPNERVYADTPTPQLRVITCGGVYDSETKDYDDNVVVFAHLDSTRRA